MADHLGHISSRICRNCELWRPIQHRRDGTATPLGKCLSPKFIRAYSEDVEIPVDGVRVEDDEGWAFETGPEFGCVHFMAWLGEPVRDADLGSPLLDSTVDRKFATVGHLQPYSYTVDASGRPRDPDEVYFSESFACLARERFYPPINMFNGDLMTRRDGGVFVNGRLVALIVVEVGGRHG